MAILRKNDWSELIDLVHQQYEKAKTEKKDCRKERSLWLRLTTYCAENRLLQDKKNPRGILVPFGQLKTPGLNPTEKEEKKDEVS